jgi:hypothetical protein
MPQTTRHDTVISDFMVQRLGYMHVPFSPRAHVDVGQLSDVKMSTAIDATSWQSTEVARELPSKSRAIDINACGLSP